jgi:hypothetical protein
VPRCLEKIKYFSSPGRPTRFHRVLLVWSGAARASKKQHSRSRVAAAARSPQPPAAGPRPQTVDTPGPRGSEDGGGSSCSQRGTVGSGTVAAETSRVAPLPAIELTRQVPREGGRIGNLVPKAASEVRIVCAHMGGGGLVNPRVVA